MSQSRNRIAMVMAEFLGTGVLTLVILAVMRSAVNVPYFVAIAAGLTVMACTLIFSAISGAHLNPVITLGLWTVRKVKTAPALVYVAAQLLGAIAAYQLFTYFVNQTWPSVPTEFEGHILVAEATGAFFLSLGWAAVVYRRVEGGKAAAALGLAVVVGMLIAAAGAGNLVNSGYINPAVALGVRSWVWTTYVLGPVLGAVIGFNLYSLLFAPTTELVESKTVDAKADRKVASKKK